MSSNGNIDIILNSYNVKNTQNDITHTISINNNLNNYCIPEDDIDDIYIEIYNYCKNNNNFYYIQEYINILFPFYIKLNINPNNLINKTIKKKHIKQIITILNKIIVDIFNYNNILTDTDIKYLESYTLINGSEIMYIMYPKFIVSKNMFKEIYKELYSKYNNELNEIFCTDLLENDKSNILYRHNESTYFYTYNSIIRDSNKYEVKFIYENNELINYDNRYTDIELIKLLSVTNKNNDTLVSKILDCRFNNYININNNIEYKDNSENIENKNNRKDILLKYYLKKFRIDKEKNPDIEASHTSMSQGTYYINDENLELFYDMQYKSVFVNEESSHIVGRRVDNHPFIIDLDFRQKNINRTYTEDNIIQFISLLNETILDVLKINKLKLQAFILEKSYRVQQKNDIYKDGIHIIYPYIYCNSYIQLYIRDLMLKEADKILNIFPFHTTTIEDLYDESIIKPGNSGNGWFVYGSSKQYNWPYVLSYILNYKLDKIECNYTNRELISLFSMRKKIKY